MHLGAHLGLMGSDLNHKHFVSLLEEWFELDLRVVSKQLLDFCKKKGIKVHVWTINERKEMKHLIGMGVDGIMTDNCRTLLDVTKEYKVVDKKIVLDPFLIT